MYTWYLYIGFAGISKGRKGCQAKPCRDVWWCVSGDDSPSTTTVPTNEGQQAFYTASQSIHPLKWEKNIKMRKNIVLLFLQCACPDGQ